MNQQHGTGRVLTTHVGSLPRPHALLDMMKAHLLGQSSDETTYHKAVREAVAAYVRRPVETGIDVLTDGEQSKPGFFMYVRERSSKSGRRQAVAPR